MTTLTADTSVYDNLPIAICLTDKNKCLTYDNKAARLLWADATHTPSVYGLPFYKLYYTNGKAVLPEELPLRQAAFESISVVKLEFIAEDTSRQYKSILLNSSPMFDAGGAFTGAIHTLTDITDHRGAGDKQAMMAAIIASSDDAIISKSIAGIITSWNKAAEQMFGYNEVEAIGRHITMLIPEDRLDEETTIISKIVKGETVDHFETIRRRKDGLHIPISVTISPVRDSLGNIVGASKIARNIARQKESKERLQQYAERLEILNSISKAIFENMDVQHILQKITDATTQLTGAAFGAFFYNVENKTGESYMLYTLSGVSKKAFEGFGMPRNTDVFRPTFEGEGIIRVADITKDARYGKNHPHSGMPTGHLPVVSYLAVPVISKAGKVIGGLFYGHPEADQFTAEHEKLVDGIASHAALALDNAKLYEEIQQLNAKKDEFIGLASHELKTPVTSISGYLQIIEKNPANWEKNQLFISKARQQMGKLAGLISDLLDVSKIETGKLPLQFSWFDMVELLNEVTEIMQYTNPSHRIIVHTSPVPLQISADRLRIEQVIINLISNAVKYSPNANQVVIHLDAVDEGIKLSVHDFGMGIDQAHLQKIFTRFYRVDDLATHISGLGIGLFISSEIVRRHKGKLEVESERGKGSTFWFTLPIS